MLPVDLVRAFAMRTEQCRRVALHEVNRLEELINAQPDPAALRGYADGLHALNRMARPEEVAEAVCWLLSERASFTTGSEQFVDGGYMIKR